MYVGFATSTLSFVSPCNLSKVVFPPVIELGLMVPRSDAFCVLHAYLLGFVTLT